MNIFLITSLFLYGFMLSPAYTMAGNESGGGGGDAQEERVNVIRKDILKWIEEGGARNLKLPMPIEDYESIMKTYLEPRYVVLGFIEQDHPSDPELQVSVVGVPKTCRGFFSRIDAKPHILCNISRFEKTSQEDQYRLIHHEYAGLAYLEKNEGAASDYEISSQLTSFLIPEVILRLSVRTQKISPEPLSLYGTYELIKSSSNRGFCPEKMLINKNSSGTPKVITFKGVTSKHNGTILIGSFSGKEKTFLNSNREALFNSSGGIVDWSNTAMQSATRILRYLSFCPGKYSFKTDSWSNYDLKEEAILNMVITQTHYLHCTPAGALFSPPEKEIHHLVLKFNRKTGFLNYSKIEISEEIGFNPNECAFQKVF